MDKAFLLYFCGWFIFLLKDTEQSTEGAGLHIIYPTALIMSKRMLNYLLMQELIQGICLFLWPCHCWVLQAVNSILTTYILTPVTIQAVMISSLQKMPSNMKTLYPIRGFITWNISDWSEVKPQVSYTYMDQFFHCFIFCFYRTGKNITMSA